MCGEKYNEGERLLQFWSCGDALIVACSVDGCLFSLMVDTQQGVVSRCCILNAAPRDFFSS